MTFCNIYNEAGRSWNFAKCIICIFMVITFLSGCAANSVGSSGGAGAKAGPGLVGYPPVATDAKVTAKGAAGSSVDEEDGVLLTIGKGIVGVVLLAGLVVWGVLDARSDYDSECPDGQSYVDDVANKCI